MQDKGHTFLHSNWQQIFVGEMKKLVNISVIKKTLKVGFSWAKNANSPKLKASQVANGGVENEKNASKLEIFFQGRKRAVSFRECISFVIFLLLYPPVN